MLDGSEHECGGEYLVVEPPYRLVMSWQWASEGAPMTRVQIVLRDAGGGTELVFTHAQLPSETSRESHESGWHGALDKLEALFVNTAAGDRPPRFTGSDAV
jgi:uncharacterized protein YndB with AHSA1/START domain